MTRETPSVRVRVLRNTYNHVYGDLPIGRELLVTPREAAHWVVVGLVEHVIEAGADTARPRRAAEAAV